MPCRRRAEQSRAELGLPFWDNRGGSRGTALGRIYRLFTVFFGAIQRLTGCSGSSRRFRNGVATVGTSQSQSLHRVFSTAPARRSPDCQMPETWRCRTVRRLSLFLSLQLPSRHHGYHNPLAAIHRPPAKAQACRAGMHHLPRQKGTNPCLPGKNVD